MAPPSGGGFFAGRHGVIAEPALPPRSRPNRPFYRNYLPSVLRLKDTNIGLIGF
jgi:hypothetical protein